MGILPNTFEDTAVRKQRFRLMWWTNQSTAPSERPQPRLLLVTEEEQRGEDRTQWVGFICWASTWLELDVTYDLAEALNLRRVGERKVLAPKNKVPRVARVLPRELDD